MTALFGVDTWLGRGYLPEAVLNYLMLLGWAPKDNREFFTLNEFVEAFDQDGVQKANPIFDSNKIDWFNGYYIRQKTDDELLKLLKPFVPENADEKKLMQIIPLIKDRIVKLSDFDSFAGFFFKRPEVDVKLFGENYKKHLSDAISIIESAKDWKLETLNEKFMEVVKSKGYKTGDFFMSLRVAITGSKFTPPINDSIIILGKEETINRIKSVA
jgi:glutamyl-tRNA synthetase